MASTEFGSADDLTVKHWSAKLATETFGETFFKRFAGKGANSIIQVHTDLSSSAGDEIKHDLRVQTRDPGVQGDAELDGYEAPLTFYQDSFKIDQLRQAHEFRRMSQQRTTHELRTAAKDSLKEWYRWVFDSMMLAYLAGLAGDGPESCSGIVGGTASSAPGFAGNVLTAPSSERTLATSGMTLQNIDTLIELAKTSNPRMEPASIDGERVYVLVLHPVTVTGLMQAVSASRGLSWTDIQMSARSSGSKNPVFTRALGAYHGVMIHESEFIPTVATSGDEAVHHNLFLGKQAGSFAMGNAFDKGDRSSMGGGGYFNWVEQRGDYRNKKGVGVASVFGMQKNIWNSTDFGVYVVADTATAATGSTT